MGRKRASVLLLIATKRQPKVSAANLVIYVFQPQQRELILIRYVRFLSINNDIYKILRHDVVVYYAQQAPLTRLLIRSFIHKN